MDTRQQIDRILRLRHEKAQGLEERKKELAELIGALEKIYKMEGKHTLIKDQNLRKEFYTNVKALHLAEVKKQVHALMNELDQVICRFNREYISIATIGKERQGKSQLLQSVSGIDNRVIPAYDGTSCTGATSIIRNDPSFAPGTLRATISYREQQEIVATVQEYVRIVDPAYPYMDIKFDDISMLPICELEQSLDGSADRQTAFGHLKKIVDNFYEFGDLFDHAPETFTDPDLIQPIVAQNNGKGEEDPALEQYYKYNAVAKAEINCRFSYDPGKVRLIDTVGIESTQLGVIQAMLDTVKNEADAAVVVTLPIANPQVEDVNLYNDISKQFSDRHPEKWLFYLVNHKKGSNDNTVVGFDRAVSSWGIAGHWVVDCSSSENVTENFMKPMLDTLLANIDDIDNTYVEILSEKETALQKTVASLLKDIDRLTGNSVGGVSGMQALEKGRQCFNTMGAQLRRVVDHYSHERNEPDYILWNETQKILNNLDVDINPGPEVIQKVADSNNVLGGEVWNIALNYVRNEITKRFSAIDDELAKENIRFKNSLVKVLFANLKELFGEGGDENDESLDMTAQLREMMEKTIANNPRYSQIYEAIVFLDNFQFNTRATIVQTVRAELSIINPLCEEYANPEHTFFAGHCGKEIDYYLTSRLSLIEENLRHALVGIYNTPNQAFFAVAEEFYDRLTFAATDFSSETLISMSNIWGSFFQEYSHLIWKDQAHDIELLNELINEIKTLRPLLEKCGSR